MPTTIDVVAALGSDWDGLFVNGRLQQEGHHIRYDLLLEGLRDSYPQGVIVRSFAIKSVDSDWLEDEGSFPTSLAEVMFE